MKLLLNRKGAKDAKRTGVDPKTGVPRLSRRPFIQLKPFCIKTVSRINPEPPALVAPHIQQSASTFLCMKGYIAVNVQPEEIKDG